MPVCQAVRIGVMDIVDLEFNSNLEKVITHEFSHLIELQRKILQNQIFMDGIMTICCKIMISMIVLFNCSEAALFAQTKVDIKPQEIIDKFIEKTGGEKWLKLESRKEYAYVLKEDDKKSIIPTQSYDRIKITMQPGRLFEYHDYSDRNTILSYNPNCNWYYSSRSQVVKFFGPERIEFRSVFPRSELMEVLNLETLKTVYLQDTLYQIDFKDSRQLDNKHSLFFGKESGLLFKRSYMSKNEVFWEFHFSDYKESQGFLEPYQIMLTSNSEKYQTYTIRSILYNVEIDTQVFNPPISCKYENDFKRLEFPYNLDVE